MVTQALCLLGFFWDDSSGMILSEMYPQLWEGLAHTVMINCDAFGVPFTFLSAKHSSHGQILQMQYVRISK